eukprot:56649_1
MSAWKLLIVLILFILTQSTIQLENVNTCTIPQFTDFDELKSFLMDHKSQLQNSIDPIYNIFHSMSLNKHNLFQLSSIDLREILTQNHLSNNHINRLIKVLQNTQNSQINKEYESTIKTFSILSKEEQIALNTIINTTNTLETHISNINTIINEIQHNHLKAEQLINERFNILINTINKRKTALLTKLTAIKTNKTNILSKQMNILNEYKIRFKKMYNKSQKIINNKVISTKQRKRRIIRKTKKLFFDIDVNKINKFKVKENPSITVRLHMKSIMNILNKFGVIEKRKSEIMTMKTDIIRPQQTTFIFGTITNGYKHWIFQKGKILKVMNKMDGFITTCNPKSYKKGIHVFKIYISGKMRGRNAFGIVSGTMPTARMHWIGEHGYKHYYLDSKNGIVYKGNDKQVSDDSQLVKWKKYDVVIMTLNCNDWILGFKIMNNGLIRGRLKKIKITKNKYYTCLTVEPKKGAKFEIVDNTW